MAEVVRNTPKDAASFAEEYMSSLRGEREIVKEFILKNRKGEEFLLQIVDKSVELWDIKKGFNEEGVVRIDSINIL